MIFPADVAQHVRMDVQTDVGQVIKMLAGNKPDDLANLAFGIIPSHARKGVRANFFVLCQLRHIIQCCALCIGKKSVGAILL